MYGRCVGLHLPAAGKLSYQRKQPARAKPARPQDSEQAHCRHTDEVNETVNERATPCGRSCGGTPLVLHKGSRAPRSAAPLKNKISRCGEATAAKHVCNAAPLKIFIICGEHAAAAGSRSQNASEASTL